MKYIKYTIATIAIIIVLVTISYGNWLLKRHINYKWTYQSMVQSEIQEQIKPLEKRIAALEIEIYNLKTNK